MQKTTCLSCALGILLAGTVAVRAQEAQNSDTGQAPKVATEKVIINTQDGARKINVQVLDDLKLRAATSGMLGSVVTGVPYSATTVNESVQTLADGNRIVQRSTFNVARDGQGRVRREELDTNGQPVSVMIMDPVANVSYMLDPSDKTARKVALLRAEGASTAPVPARGSEAGAVSSATVHVFAQSFSTSMESGKAPVTENFFYYPGGVSVMTAENKRVQGKQESLGSQTVEGVAADGTRTTTTIPAGDIGNERPIDIVSEQWYSKDLQMTISSRHSDPRFGDTTYRVTNLRRGEPDAALFQVPPDYTVKTDTQQKIIREIR